MKPSCSAVVLAALFALALSGAQQAAPPVSKIFDQQLALVERQVVSLADEMPADKYNFAPKEGEFSGVRTFGQQVTHTAAVVYQVAAAILGEKNPSEAGEAENGPANLKTKDQIVKYAKDAFAYAHKAMASLTDQNLTEMITSPFGDRKVPRLSMVTVPMWHSFDHYGQMVVYARMNGIIPPGSRK